MSVFLTPENTVSVVFIVACFRAREVTFVGLKIDILCTWKTSNINNKLTALLDTMCSNIYESKLLLFVAVLVHIF